MPKFRKRPALLGEVIGGRSRTTTRLSPALLSTLGEWTPGHMGQTALDAVGFLPLIGALKNTVFSSGCNCAVAPGI